MQLIFSSRRLDKGYLLDSEIRVLIMIDWNKKHMNLTEHPWHHSTRIITDQEYAAKTENWESWFVKWCEIDQVRQSQSTIEFSYEASSFKPKNTAAKLYLVFLRNDTAYSMLWQDTQSEYRNLTRDVVPSLPTPYQFSHELLSSTNEELMT